MQERASAGPCREADLVVDDHVERAAHAVGVELAEIERLLDDALAGEGGVAVDQDHHPVLPGMVARAVLPGPHPAQGHRIDELQMAGIEAEREVDAAAVAGLVVGRVAEVILDVAAADVELGIHVVELAEDPLRALAHDVGQHVQPAAVGHRRARCRWISWSAARSIASSSSGIRLSEPSSEKLLAPRNLFWMNSSNTAAVVIWR